MAKKKLICGLTALLLAGCGLTGLMGCGKQETAAGKTEIEIVSYKKEAVDTFNEIAEKFNETHDDIHLTNFLFSVRMMAGLFSISNAFPTRITIV